jgi:hypothetical protein
MVKQWRLDLLILLFSVLLMVSCSSGGDTDTAQGGEKTAENNTVWDKLIWDDGSGQNTTKWAD